MFPEWLSRAACRGLDPGLFLPRRGETISRQAREACASCPVSAECLDFALHTVNYRDHGVKAGLSERTRQKMRKELHAG